jgi:hypothetical protein
VSRGPGTSDVLQRVAARAVDDLDAQVEAHAALALGDVLADLVEVEVVRTLLLLGDERARGRGRVGLVLEVPRTEEAEAGEAEAGSAEAAQRAAAGESVI